MYQINSNYWNYINPYDNNLPLIEQLYINQSFTADLKIQLPDIKTKSKL
jgi:hypothetical protein